MPGRHSNLALFIALIIFELGWAQSAQGGSQPESKQESATVELDEVDSHSPIKVESVQIVSDVPLSSASEKHLVRYLTHHKIYDGDAWLEELEDHVKYFWQQHGYFEVAVSSRARRVTAKPTDRVFAVTFTVSAGRQYRLGKISISGAKEFSTAALRAVFDMQEGDVFNVHTIAQGIEALRLNYNSKGFIECAVVPDTEIDRENGRIALHLTIDEGQQFHIGEVTLPGFDPEEARKLLGNSGLQTGAVFSPRLIDDFMARNKSALPHDADAEDDVERRINEQNATVDLILKFKREPQD
jgi:outer membrane protein assembly factor BamA